MGNEFDKVFKENIEQIIASFAKRLMQIDLENTIDLRGKLQITQEREPDFLMQYFDKTNNVHKIAHLEIHSTDDPNMDKKELMYYGLFHFKFGLSVNQTVVYVGNKPLKKMKGEVISDNIHFRYRLIDIRAIAYEDFLNSDIPEEVILAILGDFHNENPELVAQKIVERLNLLSKKDKGFGKYTRQLQVLSKLRNLQPIVKQNIKVMPLNIDYTLEEDALYEMGIEKGAKTQKEISEKEKLEDKKKSAIEMLKAGLSVEQISNFLNISRNFVEDIKGSLSK